MTEAYTKDKNALAMLLWLVVTAALYVLWVFVAAGALESTMGGGAREGVWRYVAFVLLFQLPQLVAGVLAALTVKAAVRPFNRMLLYYYTVAIAIVGSAVYALMLVWSLSWRGFILAAVQLLVLYAAWRLLRAIWRPHPEPPPVE